MTAMRSTWILAAALVTAAPAAEAGIVTVTTSGEISSGTLRQQGSPTLDLAGLGYTMVQVFDTANLAAVIINPPPQAFSLAWFNSASMTLSIDGTDWSFTVAKPSGGLVNEHGYNTAMPNTGNADHLYSKVDGTNGSTTVFAEQFLDSFQSSFVTDTTLTRPLSYVRLPGDQGATHVAISNAATGFSLSFDALPERIRLDVPEPASMALFGAGLLGLVGLRRRQPG